MKEEYEKPFCDFTEYEETDVITTSLNVSDDDDDEGWTPWY